MKISIRLAALLEKHGRRRRGLIAEIEKRAKIERHTVAGLLNNTAKYVSIDALARICDYLIDVHGVPADILPGALLVRNPERFWEMLAACQRLEFCIGTRVSKDWPGAEYVMATDSRLQGVLLSRLSRLDEHRAAPSPAQAAEAARKEESKQKPPEQERAGPGAPAGPGPLRRQHAQFHLVAAPSRRATAQAPGANWAKVVARANGVYQKSGGGPSAPGAPGGTADEGPGQWSALFALGSVKVNPVVELVLATAFGGSPFVSLDNKLAKAVQRPCPMLFRYRDDDPQPPSFCGGVQIAADTPAPKPGLYYESDKGKWECCPWDAESGDAAFVFYASYPHLARVEVACGGFSSRATDCLTNALNEIIPALGEPQYKSRQVAAGMYLVEFHFEPGGAGENGPQPGRLRDFKVVPVPEKALARRLKHWQ